MPRDLKWLRKVINKSLGSGWIVKNRQIAERTKHYCQSFKHMTGLTLQEKGHTHNQNTSEINCSKILRRSSSL